MRYRLLFVTLFVAGSHAAPAAAAPTWNDSNLATVTTTNCLTGATETLSSSYVGWYGDVNAPPSVGSTFYIRVGWGVTGNPCIGGAKVAPELFLPVGTSLAISAANPVKCYAINLATGGYAQDTGSCPQGPSVGVRGGLGFYPPQAVWPTAQGFGWEIQIPIIATAPLGGVVNSTCNDCITGAVWSIDGITSPWAFPQVAVTVSGGSLVPTITYASPSTTNITSSGATGTILLSRAGTTGNAFIEESPSPFAAACAPSSNLFAITAQDPAVKTLQANFSAEPAGSTVYWRACYQSGTSIFIGATQSFRTIGTAPPHILALSRAIALPGDSMSVTGTDLAGATLAYKDSTSQTTTISGATATSSSIQFQIPATLYQTTGTLIVTTPGGTASASLEIGIDTLKDSVVVDALDGTSTQKDDVKITFHATEPGANMFCTLDNGPTSTSCYGGSVTYYNLAPGSHSMAVTTSYGLYSDLTPLVVSFAIVNPDTTPPETVLTQGPAAPWFLAPSTTVPFAFASPDLTARFECSNDGVRFWYACASPVTFTNQTTGHHWFSVRARDPANNVDPTPVQVYYTVAPIDTSITSGPPSMTMLPTASFTFAGVNASQFQCRIDNGPFLSCLSGRSTFGPLMPGTHTFAVRGVDIAGNVDPTPATWTWTIM